MNTTPRLTLALWLLIGILVSGCHGAGLRALGKVEGGAVRVTSRALGEAAEQAARSGGRAVRINVDVASPTVTVPVIEAPPVAAPRAAVDAGGGSIAQDVAEKVVDAAVDVATAPPASDDRRDGQDSPSTKEVR